MNITVKFVEDMNCFRVKCEILGCVFTHTFDGDVSMNEIYSYFQGIKKQRYEVLNNATREKNQ